MKARKLVLSHMAREVKKGKGNVETDPQVLPEGYMQLFSYYRPGLLADDYTIDVSQKVTAGNQVLSLLNTRTPSHSATAATTAVQDFTVVVSRFSIDRTIINSYYPPDGHQDEGRILPHIVFNDPHYPWEIAAGSLTNMSGAIDAQTYTVTTDKVSVQKTRYRNMVPWVALLVFDVDELRLTDITEAKSFGLAGFSTQADLAKQNANGTFAMTVADYLNLPTTTQVKKVAGSTEAVNIIFPKQNLIKTLVGQYFPTANGMVPSKLDVEGYKYLAHVRHTNIEGCPEAAVGDQGYFSIVISSRTGPIKINQPTTQVCHLVSIENLDSTIPSWPANSTSRIGMISLFSWIYTALPPNPVNFVTTMRNLTEAQQMLRMDDVKLDALDKSISTGDTSQKAQVGQIMSQRLRNGYTLSRWRTQTGEETAAFNRGPLVPQAVKYPPASDIADCSNTSQEYQILDPQTGLMDLSYSSAWQVGKLLAISDTTFSAALMRFRSTVHNSAGQATKMTLNDMSSKAELIKSLKSVVPAVQSMSAGDTPDANRVRENDPDRSATLLSSSRAAALLQTVVASKVALNTTAGTDTGAGVWNEFNAAGPNNSDWVVIHNWLAEKLLLGGIPPHYLLPESAYLPQESLRFFVIDAFWLDCLLDGALSLANHLDKDDDTTRREIKSRFNTYLSSVVAPATIKPQIPSHGFIIRSKLIQAMPDLKINITWQKPDDRYPFCRWTKWDDETLMCLLDRPFEELRSIIIEQPPHQQRFSLGSGVKVQSDGTVTVHFDIRTLYTQNPLSVWPDKMSLVANDWYDEDSRALKLTYMAKAVNGILKFGPDESGSAYLDDMPNSCEFGLELNDPCYYFEIHAPEGIPTFVARNRQLWITPPKTTPDTGKDANKSSKSDTSSVPSAAPPPSSNSGARQSSTTSSPQAKTTPHQPQASPPATTFPTPPHQQARIQPPGKGPSNLKTVASPIVQTQFDLTIFADYKGPPPSPRVGPGGYDPSDFIPTNNIYLYDLIFSIRKKPSLGQSKYQLIKIVIELPVLSSSGATPKTEPLLMPDYDGPGLRMLANQRFIPFLFHEQPDAPLNITLIPRSTNDDYAIILNDRKTT